MEADRFVVRYGAGWFLAGLSPAAPSPVGLDEVLELVGSCHTPVSGSGELTVDPRRSDSSVLDRSLVPARAIVGRVHDGYLQVEDSTGVPLLLDRVDLRIVDAVGDGAMGRSLALLGEERSIGDRIERLLEAGVLRQGEPMAVPATGEHPAAVIDTPEVETAAEDQDVASSLAHGGSLTTVLSAAMASIRGLGRRLRSSSVPFRRQRPASFPNQARVGRATGTSVSRPVDDTTDVIWSTVLDQRIPVYAIWHDDVGPMLSVGLLLVALRCHDGGSLSERYEIRRVESVDSFLADLSRREGPAVLLCSDYVWSTERNLSAARAGLSINPDLVVVHGGPNSPKYEADAAEFMDRHREVAHVLVRGEGEVTVCELLAAVADSLPVLDPHSLGDVAGITFRTPAGDLVRTDDRERIADLDLLPSPYLTGEFDHIPADAWPFRTMFIETNRGCPYGCTFCDWGSATLARVRKFSADRVLAECEWGRRHGFDALFVCDANFGILPQDEDIARRLVEIREATGFPSGIGMTFAKKSTGRVMRVVDTFLDGGIPVNSTVSLQSIDPETLRATHRDNIPIDTYLELASKLRHKGYGLQGDVILGLPGQTYDAYRRDIQFMVDHEIMPRTWPVRVLVNSPMNEPAYRREYAIESDEDGFLLSTSTMSPADLERALRMRTVDEIADRYGLLRHVLRLLQWDHGLPITAVEEHVIDVTTDRPEAYPLLTWVFNNFDLYATVPIGRSAFYDEVRRFVEVELGLDDRSDLRTVLRLQHCLCPAPGRRFPETVDLEHDYVAYYLDGTRSLYETGHAGRPPRPLTDYPPATFTVDSDPMQVCEAGIFAAAGYPCIPGKDRDRMIEPDFHVGSTTANELMSPLVRILPVMAGFGPTVVADRLERMGLDALGPSGVATNPDLADERESIPVSLRPSSSSAEGVGPDRATSGT